MKRRRISADSCRCACSDLRNAVVTVLVRGGECRYNSMRGRAPLDAGRGLFLWGREPAVRVHVRSGRPRRAVAACRSDAGVQSRRNSKPVWLRRQSSNSSATLGPRTSHRATTCPGVPALRARAASALDRARRARHRLCAVDRSAISDGAPTDFGSAARALGARIGCPSSMPLRSPSSDRAAARRTRSRSPSACRPISARAGS